MDAIILAGGLGTRIQSISGGLPKPMMSVQGKPFLYYLMDYAARHSAKKIILSIGFRADVIQNHFGSVFGNVDIDYVFEDSPLGTGGAIKKALETTTEKHIIILNGDSFFKIDLIDFMKKHIESGADITMALKPMRNFDRYGSVTIEGEKITSFNEKQFVSDGIINAGIYCVKNTISDFFPAQEKFSFEKDVLEKNIQVMKIHPYISDGFFIDIGIPEDYLRIKDNFEL